MLAELLKRTPWLVTIGAALLGWIAVQVAVSDVVFGDALAVNAPALVALSPALGAAFVFCYGRVLGLAPVRVPPVSNASGVRQVSTFRFSRSGAAGATDQRESQGRAATRPAFPSVAALRSAGKEAEYPPAAPSSHALPIYEPSGEPQDQRKPAEASSTYEDRVAVVGMLVLAVVAGLMLLAASYLDAFN